LWIILNPWKCYKKETYDGTGFDGDLDEAGALTWELEEASALGGDFEEAGALVLSPFETGTRAVATILASELKKMQIRPIELNN